jgi:hypothetical protein
MTTPEERINEEKLKQERLKKRAEYKGRVKAALSSVLKTQDGQVVFRYLAEICDQFSYKHVVPVAGGIDVPASMHNLARNSVYIDMRRMMTEEDKRIIESKGETE